MRSQDRFKAGLKIRPMGRLHLDKVIPQFAEPTNRALTIVGVSQDFLHLDHLGIESLAKFRNETTFEQLHRVAQLLA